MRKSTEAKIGDTYTTVGSQHLVEKMPGFEEPKPMVFVAAFPVDQGDFEHLEDSIDQLLLNDRAVTITKESSHALGAGFRLGFLGTLHCSVSKIAFVKNTGASIIITPPTVPFKIIYKNGKKGGYHQPGRLPDDDVARRNVAELREPYVLTTLTFPDEISAR